LQSEQEGMGASEQELKLYPFLYSDTDALHHRSDYIEWEEDRGAAGYTFCQTVL
jgi:hypothetical protein